MSVARRWILTCAVLTAAVVGVTAAGAAGSFATAMNKICRTANRRTASVGVSQSLFELAQNEPLLLAVGKWKLARLVALGKAPAAISGHVTIYVQAQRKLDTAETKLITAARQVHLATVEKLQQQARSLEQIQDAAARRIGATQCLSTASP